MSFTPGQGEAYIPTVEDDGEQEKLIKQREQSALVEGSEKFHVLAVTRDGQTHHVNTVYADDEKRAMNLTAMKYHRKHSGESKERVFAFHEATEFKVVRDNEASRFKKRRGNTQGEFDEME